jgi:hypothetical protein
MKGEKCSAKSPRGQRCHTAYQWVNYFMGNSPGIEEVVFTVAKICDPPKTDNGDYVSGFSRWDRQASVRVKERQLVTQLVAEEKAGKVFFPAAMVPVLDHPTVKTLGAEVYRQLQIRSLHTYLDFTAELEQCVVNPVTCQLSRSRFGIRVPPKMAEDAYKIYVDEAWHSCFSDDLQRQIEHATAVGQVNTPCPAFMERLAYLEESLSPRDRRLARAFFAIVSETLISAFLSEIPGDHSVIEPVRALIADHAIDEGRHHVYFSHLLHWLWPQLSSREQLRVGQMLPDFIRSFLDPDLRAVAVMLLQSSLTEDEVQQVLADTYDGEQSHEFSARHTVRHLGEVGVLDDPQISEGFQTAGLL